MAAGCVKETLSQKSKLILFQKNSRSNSCICLFLGGRGDFYKKKRLGNIFKQYSNILDILDTRYFMYKNVKVSLKHLIKNPFLYSLNINICYE